MAEGNPTSLAPMTELFDFLTERGVLSALYLASLAYPLVIANQGAGTTTIDSASIAIVCIVLGLIVSKITYEFLLDYVWPLTEPIVLSAFQQTAGSDVNCRTYTQFRVLREGLIGRDVTGGQQYLKERILKNEALRHTITYLFCANALALVALIAVAIASVVWPGSLMAPPALLRVELVVVIYVLLATVVGERSRSAALGRSIAHAYLELSATQRAEAPRAADPARA
jgi:hypothetical protein